VSPEFFEHPASAARIISQFERTVIGVLARAQLRADEQVLVALSGGPDSVGLFHALERSRRRLNFRLCAAHLNHALRGSESDRDERFVRELCQRHNVELVVERAHGLRPPNLEERAREIRHDFLNRTAEVLGSRLIALGHNRDDQAETVLLRMMRGSGTAGLAAMAEFGPGRRIRPLLTVNRAAILAYLGAIGADYVVDTTNLQRGALRNRVRNLLMPQLERDYGPGLARRLAELASEIREVNSLIELEAQERLAERLIHQPPESASWRLDLRGLELINAGLTRAMLRELLRRSIGDLRRIERVHVNAMFNLAMGGNPSASINLPRGWKFTREYEIAKLDGPAEIDASNLKPFAVKLITGENPVNGNSMLTLCELVKGEQLFPAAPWHPNSAFEAYFDAAAVGALVARSFQPGDRIQPSGLRGTRKVHDVFVDHKVPVRYRGCWPLIISGAAVVWIPGLVRSDAALITSATKKVLYLRMNSLPGLRNV
jgi:tRNA(Ile)-lysidine synthase